MHVDKKVPFVLQIKYIVNYRAFPIYFYKHYTCTCIFYILPLTCKKLGTQEIRKEKLCLQGKINVAEARAITK